jgi:hypothetical protein
VYGGIYINFFSHIASAIGSVVLVYLAEKPIDIVLNAVALVFINDLDNSLVGSSDTLKVKSVVVNNFAQLDSFRIAALQRMHAIDKQAEFMLEGIARLPKKSSPDFPRAVDQYNDEMAQASPFWVRDDHPSAKEVKRQLKDAKQALTNQILLQFSMFNVPKPGCYAALGLIFRCIMFAVHFFLLLAPFFLFICK